jgi:hypothetical protein
MSIPDETLPCLNCKQPSGTDPQCFKGIFVCARCYAVAVRTAQRLRQELESLYLLAQEEIRLSLIEGRLHFVEGPQEAPDKKAVLQAILQLPEPKSRKRHGR